MDEKKNDFEESSEKNFSTFLNTHLSSIHHQKRKKNMRTVLKLKPNVNIIGNNSGSMLNKTVCPFPTKCANFEKKVSDVIRMVRIFYTKSPLESVKNTFVVIFLGANVFGGSGDSVIVINRFP